MENFNDQLTIGKKPTSQVQGIVDITKTHSFVSRQFSN
jgi:hypothetical protein